MSLHPRSDHTSNTPDFPLILTCVVDLIVGGKSSEVSGKAEPTGAKEKAAITLTTCTY
jgi:hypothetical protein